MEFSAWEEISAYQLGFRDGFQWNRLCQHFLGVTTIEDMFQDEFQEEYIFLFCTPISDLLENKSMIKRILNRYL